MRDEEPKLVKSFEAGGVVTEVPWERNFPPGAENRHA